MKVSQNKRNVSLIQQKELFKKSGTHNRYWKLEFTQGIFPRVELLGTQQSTKNMQNSFGIACRRENMAIQAIELSKGDITQGLHQENGRYLCRLHRPTQVKWQVRQPPTTYICTVRHLTRNIGLIRSHQFQVGVVYQVTFGSLRQGRQYRQQTII